MHSMLATRLCAALAVAVLTAPGSAQSALASFTGDFGGDSLGQVVERIGDVDADGTLDFAVGAPRADDVIGGPFPFLVVDAGELRVYSGATLQLLWIAEGPGTDAELGAAIADAGDQDGDGRDDVLVGAPGADGFVADTGIVQLRSGLDGSLIRTFNGFQSGQRFGAAICAGDMDPLPGQELAVGAPFHDLDDNQGGILQEGFVYILDMDDGTVRRFIPGGVYDADSLINIIWYRRHWGERLLYLGDGDGNGYGEIVVSAPYANVTTGTAPVNSGFVRIFEPLDDDPPPGQDYSMLGYEAGGFTGLHLALVDDVDGDGIRNFALSRSVTDEVDVFNGVLDVALYIFGTPGKLWATWPVLDGLTALDGSGDFDGDGVGDLACGYAGAGADPGRVQAFSVLDGLPLVDLHGSQVGARFGGDVAGFDHDGDGQAELVVGERLWDEGALVDAGRATVFTDVTCEDAASWANYGSGLAGTFGVPSLTGVGLPALGNAAFAIDIGNSAGVAAQTFLLVGLSTLNLPKKGGVVLVDALITVPFVLPIGTTALPLPVPYDLGLCGAVLYLQNIQADQGAPLGAAFTPGLALTLGL